MRIRALFAAIALTASLVSPAAHAQEGKAVAEVAEAAEGAFGEGLLKGLLGEEGRPLEGEAAERLDRALQHMRSEREAALRAPEVRRKQLLNDIAQGRSFGLLGALDSAPFRAALIEADLAQAERWLQGATGGGSPIFLHEVDGIIVLSADGREFNYVAASPEQLYRHGRPYVIHPSVLHAKQWTWISATLKDANAVITLDWEIFGTRRTLSCRWLRGSASLMLESHPNFFAPIDAPLARRILPRPTFGSELPNTELDFLSAEPESADAAPFRFQDLHWLNLQTAGDIRPLTRVFSVERTVALNLARDGQIANLTRFKNAVRGLRGKLVMLTGHLEGTDFVAKRAGSELFRIPVHDAISLLQEAGANVLPVGCDVAEVAGSGPLDAVTPRLIADGIDRARDAANVLEFQIKFAGPDMPVVAADISMPSPARVHIPLARGKLVGLAGTFAVAQVTAIPTATPPSAPSAALRRLRPRADAASNKEPDTLFGRADAGLVPLVRPAPPQRSGCGCRVSGEKRPPWPVVPMLVTLLFLHSRRIARG